MKHYSKLLIIATSFSFFLSGCSTIPKSESKDTVNNIRKTESIFSYATSYHNRSSSDFLCYRSLEGDYGTTTVLDYESMKNVPLCNKPNCKHNKNDCVIKRLNGNTPMFGEECIYYFVDDDPYLKQNDEGKSEYVYHSELCRYDLKTDTEKSMLSVEMEVANNCYGWMLLDDKIYFIGHRYSSSSDETGSSISVTNTGGDMKLYAVHLPDMQVTDLGDLYDMPELRKYYPLASDSGEVYMEGLFNNKIYFNVAFVIEENGQYHYHFYVTYYDLTDGTYHGTPEDYEHIDFSAVSYISDDYLVICREDAAVVYKKGSEQPVILEDTCFNQDVDVTVFDDVLYYYEKAFDLNSGNVRQIDFMSGKEVVAKYGDSFIIADSSMQENFEKIPAEKLLN